MDCMRLLACYTTPRNSPPPNTSPTACTQPCNQLHAVRTTYSYNRTYCLHGSQPHLVPHLDDLVLAQRDERHE